MTREQLNNFLQQAIKSNDIGGGDYHTSETIEGVLEAVLTQYGSPSDEIKDIEDLYNAMWESCDAATPIYNTDIMEWFKTNYTALEDYSSNMGTVNIDEGGIINAIRGAYCYTLEQEAMSELHSLYDNASNELAK